MQDIVDPLDLKPGKKCGSVKTSGFQWPAKYGAFHRDFMLIYRVSLGENVVDHEVWFHIVLDWLFLIYLVILQYSTHTHTYCISTVYMFKYIYIYICMYVCIYIYIIVCVYIYSPFVKPQTLLFFMVLPICLILQHQLFQPPPSYCTKTAPGSSVHSSFRCLVVLGFILLAPRTRQGFVEIMTWRKNFIELKNCV